MPATETMINDATGLVEKSSTIKLTSAILKRWSIEQETMILPWVFVKWFMSNNNNTRFVLQKQSFKAESLWT